MLKVVPKSWVVKFESVSGIKTEFDVPDGYTQVLEGNAKLQSGDMVLDKQEGFRLINPEEIGDMVFTYHCVIRKNI